MADMTAGARPAADLGQSFGGLGYRSYVLGALLLAYIFNFIDRVIIAYLSVPIKAEFDLANWQFGLLSGIAFATFYTFLGIPIARLAEHFNRTIIIGVSIMFWSVMTALCGVATSFAMLLIFRLGVGVGEAGLTPPANSLIADYYKPEKRAPALAIYSTGITIGSFCAALFVGFALGIVDWRTTFLIVGLAGIPVGLAIIFTVKEPPRGFSDPPGTVRPKPPTIGEALGALSRNASFWYVTLGGTLASFVGYALVTFTMEFLTKAFAMTVPQAALFFLAPLALIGAVGTWLCGALAGVFKGKSALWLPALGLAVATCLHILALNLVAGATVVLGILIAANLFQYFYLGPMYAVSGSVVDARMRATAIAILLFVVNLIGYGVGPPAAGVVIDIFYSANLADVAGLTAEICRTSETLTASEIGQCQGAELSAIRVGLSMVCLLFSIGSIFFLLGMKTIDHDLAKLRA
ncbi:MAG: MFS transporter [Pseudomonadota bacterium]